MSRKITKRSIAAFLDGHYFSEANTVVIEVHSVWELRLHGNTIAIRDTRNIPETISICTSGWDTVTTRERLNGIPGVSVYHKKGELFLNGERWDGKWKRIK